MVSKILKGSVHTFTKYFQHPDLERNSLVYMFKKKKKYLVLRKIRMHGCLLMAVTSVDI